MALRRVDEHVVPALAVHRLKVAKPGSPGFALVRSVNIGTPAATSSERNRRAYGLPLFPSYTYMRVFPFASFVTSIAGRDWIRAALRDGLICVHVAPPSGERQTPRAYEAA